MRFFISTIAAFLCFARATHEWNLIDNETSYSKETYRKELNGGEIIRERKEQRERGKRARDVWC